MFNICLNDGGDLPEDDVLYVISKNGIFLRKKLGIVESFTKVDQISILEESAPYAHLDIEKIPNEDFARLVNFFRAVYEKYASEGMSIMHYNQKSDDHKIQVPFQKVSGGSVDYVKNVTFKGFDKIGTIHSHANFSAFHSEIDDHDEESWDGIHITVGHCAEDLVSISASVMFNKKRFEIDPTDYIEGIEAKQAKRYEIEDRELYQFPESWMMYVESASESREKALEALNRKFGHVKYNNYRGLFDGVGNTIRTPISQIPTEDIICESSHLNSPCETCPFKEHKLEIQMEQLLEEMDLQEVDEVEERHDDDPWANGLGHPFRNIS